jgi:hypothetical protein
MFEMSKRTKSTKTKIVRPADQVARFKIEDDHSCMPNAINCFFGARVFNKLVDYQYLQVDNLRRAHVALSDVFNQHMSDYVEFRGVEMKRVFLYQYTRIQHSMKWRVDSFFWELPDGRYIIDYCYRDRENHRNTKGHFVCISKICGKIYVISDPVDDDEVLPKVGYQFNQEPKYEERKVDLRKVLKLLSMQVFTYVIE